MAKPVGGTAYIKIDGNQYSTDGKFSITIQNDKMEAFSDSAGDILRKEFTQPSKISGMVYTTEDLDVNTLTSIEDATITIEANNGKTYTLRNACFTGDAAIDTDAGSMSIEFSGYGLVS